MDIVEGLFGRYTQKFFSVARIIIGFLFLSHGAQKLFGAFGEQGTFGSTEMLFAGIIEFFGGVLFVLGFKTRYVAIITAAEMLFAYLSVHQLRGIWPIQNGGELALVYFCFFLFSIPNGAGAWSLDSFLKKND